MKGCFWAFDVLRKKALFALSSFLGGFAMYPIQEITHADYLKACSRKEPSSQPRVVISWSFLVIRPSSIELSLKFGTKWPKIDSKSALLDGVAWDSWPSKGGVCGCKSGHESQCFTLENASPNHKLGERKPVGFTISLGP